MKIVNVNLKDHKYKIVIGSRILGRLGAALKTLGLGKDAVVITSPKIRKLHGAEFSKGLRKKGYNVKFFEVPDGERSKSAKVSVRLIEDVAKYDVKRKIFIVAFGGGVIGDLAGYVASVYKRGVPYVQVPTTFLAQVDSSIGGKVGIDLSCGKNLVGAIYQPKIVWSDVNVLKTLDKRQIRNGLSESVKYGIIRDKSLFNYIAKNYHKLLSLDDKALTKVVIGCSRIKANVVVQDERETRSIRTILNFGHTVGHAIEAASQYNYYNHGEAVALGMRVAADISRRLGLLSMVNVDRINQVITDVGLPQTIRNVRLSKVLNTMAHDKKFVGRKNRFVLATDIGKVVIREGVPLNTIKGAIKSYSSKR